MESRLRVYFERTQIPTLQSVNFNNFVFDEFVTINSRERDYSRNKKNWRLNRRGRGAIFIRYILKHANDPKYVARILFLTCTVIVHPRLNSLIMTTFSQHCAGSVQRLSSFAKPSNPSETFYTGRRASFHFPQPKFVNAFRKRVPIFFRRRHEKTTMPDFQFGSQNNHPARFLSIQLARVSALNVCIVALKKKKWISRCCVLRYPIVFVVSLPRIVFEKQLISEYVYRIGFGEEIFFQGVYE